MDRRAHLRLHLLALRAGARMRSLAARLPVRVEGRGGRPVERKSTFFGRGSGWPSPQVCW